jgi:hypothetical protein
VGKDYCSTLVEGLGVTSPFFWHSYWVMSLIRSFTKNSGGGQTKTQRNLSPNLILTGPTHAHKSYTYEARKKYLRNILREIKMHNA